MQSSHSIQQIQLKTLDKKNRLMQKFPSINFTSTSRALMSLSKRQKLDGLSQFLSMHVSKQIKPKLGQFQILRITHSTETSINRFRQAQKSLTKIGKTLNFVKKFQEQKYKPTTNISPQAKINRYEQIDKLYKTPKMLIKQQNSSNFNGDVKFCDKKFGCIQSYAISSHFGTINTVNNTRICVSTNVFQNFNKTKQVSFFGLFQGRNGSNRAEHMRQNFHTTLVNDQLFYYNFERAVGRTFQKLQRDFNYDQRYEGDYSIVNSVICVIVDMKMYIIRQGAPNATISTNLGSYIKTLSLQQKQLPNHKYSISSTSAYNKKLLAPKQNLHLRMFQINKTCDFVILGNEGLFHTINKKNQLGLSLWKYMLDQSLVSKMKNVHNKLAKACSKICEDAVKADSLGRSMSIVVIQFGNMGQCFQQQSELSLPYVTNTNSNNFILKDD